MEISIIRFGSYHHAVSGRLMIEGQHICDTLEEDIHSLPLGEYELSRDSALELPYYIEVPPGISLPALEITPAQRVSLSMGNGIHGWRSHCIVVGECLHLGFLIHSHDCYEQLLARIRMQFVRHHVVVVRILRAQHFVEAG